VPKLVKILKDENFGDDSYCRACHAMFFLTVDPDVRDSAVKIPGFVETLVKGLGSTSGFLKFSVLMLMANVVDIGEGEKETSRVLDVSDQGLLYYFESGIQDCLDGKKNMFEIGDISRCIQRLSASNSNKESIGKGQTIRLLLNTLKFPKASQKDLEGAAGALWALAFF